jgi:hypothetical protein
MLAASMTRVKEQQEDHSRADHRRSVPSTSQQSLTGVSDLTSPRFNSSRELTAEVYSTNFMVGVEFFFSCICVDVNDVHVRTRESTDLIVVLYLHGCVCVVR